MSQGVGLNEPGRGIEEGGIRERVVAVLIGALQVSGFVTLLGYQPGRTVIRNTAPCVGNSRTDQPLDTLAVLPHLFIESRTGIGLDGVGVRPFLDMGEDGVVDSERQGYVVCVTGL